MKLCEIMAKGVQIIKHNQIAWKHTKKNIYSVTFFPF